MCTEIYFIPWFYDGSYNQNRHGHDEREIFSHFFKYFPRNDFSVVDDEWMALDDWSEPREQMYDSINGSSSKHLPLLVLVLVLILPGKSGNGTHDLKMILCP